VSEFLWLAIVALALAAGLVAGRRDFGGQKARVEPTDQLAVLTSILDVIPDAAVLVDTSDVVIAASSNCAAMGLISGDRLAPVELRALNRESHRQGESLSKECVVKRNGTKLGEWEARIQASPIDDSVALIIAQDLSESRRLNDVRRDFVANVSHELKTPVGALSLLAEAILAADSDVSQTRKFAERMQLEVRRLTDLVSDLVELSRVQGESHMRNSRPVLVKDIVNEAVDTMKLAAHQKDITIDVANMTEVGAVFGDDKQLTTALRNLVSNAVNYSPAGTKVGVGARRLGDTVEISVTDQGPGIPEADQERIFERFYRVDPARSRDTGGTGLGLAIVKHVCANHGGDCTVWSRPGQGATFTLHLPGYLGPIEQGAFGK
jgi:two-component system sensor histidine kinase SenX3